MLPHLFLSHTKPSSLHFGTASLDLRLYAVSLIPHVRHLSQPWKLLMGFWLTDETFAVAIARYHQPDASPYKHLLVTACVSGGVALFSHHLPHQMGLIVAAIVGASAGILTENMQVKFK